MQNFAILAKSFANDIERAKNLIKSFVEFNKDNIPLYLSIPKDDYPLFNQENIFKKVKLVIDEDVSGELISERINSFPIGYINQQIVKLSFWKCGFCENYFCVDSDSYFIRNFYYKDFMFDEKTPYTILIQDKDLSIEPGYQGFWNVRLDRLEYIKNQLNYEDRLVRTSHGFGILSAKVLKSFEQDFMGKKRITYKDILKESSFEMSWYNFWLQKNKVIEIIPIEPLFKTFHFRNQYFDYRKRMITEKDISRAYIGICLNSNWLKNPKSLQYENPSWVEKNLYRGVKNMKRISEKISNIFLILIR